MSYDIEYCKKYEPIFGSWYIKKKLGEGNFGAVFEIEREDFGTKYHAALKIISIPKNRSELESIMNDTMDVSATEKYIEQVVERIVKEFELMAKLKGNSNVVSYEDHQVIKHQDDAGWDVLIRMELLTPMLTYFKSKDITRRDVVNLGIDICRALELCKKNNIIHRDIKPENIFVSESGGFKLGDFGIAKQVEESQSELTKIGTPTYMAPEVVKGFEYDASVDMYSLGVVMYRFLNHNRTPFMPQYPAEISYGDKDRAFGERINSGKPFPMPSNVGSPELASVILRACSYNPAERFSSPEHMRRLLEGILTKTSAAVLDMSVTPHVNTEHATPAPNFVPVQNANINDDKDDGTTLIDSHVLTSPNKQDYSQVQSRSKYVVNPGQTIIFDNVTGNNVVLTRATSEPIDIVIIKGNEAINNSVSWTKKDIGLAAGYRVQITNKNPSVITFDGNVGISSVQVSHSNRVATHQNKKKSRALSIILVSLAILVLLIGVGVAFALGLFDGFLKEDEKSDYAPTMAHGNIALERIDGLSENYELEAGEKTVLSPVGFPEGAELENVNYTSSDESVAYVEDNVLCGISEGNATITVSSGDVLFEFTVEIEGDNNIAERDRLTAEITQLSSEVADNLQMILDDTEKDMTLHEDRINQALETMNVLLEIKIFRGLSTEELSAINVQWIELSDEVKELVKAFDEASVKKCTKCGLEGHLAESCTNTSSQKTKCSYCGSTRHVVHPTCWYCGSKDHTTHPQCSKCGSYDHTDANHPIITIDF